MKRLKAIVEVATVAAILGLFGAFFWNISHAKNFERASVRVASTANVDIASAPSAIDGVTLTSGDRVLLKDQSTASQNGIYIFNGAGSTMTRAIDADASAELAFGIVSMRTSVTEGNTHAHSSWQLYAISPITLDKDALKFRKEKDTGPVIIPYVSGR